MIDFDKPIIVTNWRTDEVVAELPVEGNAGLHIIARSARWDSQHTSAVRTIHLSDLYGAFSKYFRKIVLLGHIDDKTPVTFSQ